jgi:hypothetical protein
VLAQRLIRSIYATAAKKCDGPQANCPKLVTIGNHWLSTGEQVRAA